MLRKPVVLITGASGEIGHGLITHLAEQNEHAIVTLDLNPLEPELPPKVRQQLVGSILDAQLLDRVLAEFEIDLVFHLAALLSTRSEFAPTAAHRVNVEELASERVSAPMGGGTLFQARAKILVPAGANLPAMRADLEKLAADLMVDLTLHPADGGTNAS